MTHLCDYQQSVCSIDDFVENTPLRSDDLCWLTISYYVAKNGSMIRKKYCQVFYSIQIYLSYHLIERCSVCRIPGGRKCGAVHLWSGGSDCSQETAAHQLQSPPSRRKIIENINSVLPCCSIARFGRWSTKFLDVATLMSQNGIRWNQKMESVRSRYKTKNS